MAVILSHLLAAYAILLAPWLGHVYYRRAQRRIASGVPDAKLRLYQSMAVEQIGCTAVVLAIWRLGRIPAASLGLVAPRSWGLTLGVFVGLAGLLVWSSLKVRPKADKIREKVKDKVGALLPDSLPERRWYGAISLGAGISEELVYRGFLLYYFGAYVPHLNMFERVLLTSICFGVAHVYQGKLQIVSTGVLGLVFAGLYLVSGSLLLPGLVHAAVDTRLLIMFPPPAASPSMPVGSNA